MEPLPLRFLTPISSHIFSFIFFSLYPMFFSLIISFFSPPPVDRKELGAASREREKVQLLRKRHKASLPGECDTNRITTRPMW